MLEEVLQEVAADKRIVEATLTPIDCARLWPKMLRIIFEDGGGMSCIITEIMLMRADGSGVGARPPA